MNGSSTDRPTRPRPFAIVLEPANRSRSALAERLRQDSAAWTVQLALLAWIVAAWLAARSLGSSDASDVAPQTPPGHEQVDAAGL